MCAAENILHGMPYHDQVLMTLLARRKPGMPDALIGVYKPLRLRMEHAGVVVRVGEVLELTTLGHQVAQIASKQSHLCETAASYDRISTSILAEHAARKARAGQ